MRQLRAHSSVDARVGGWKEAVDRGVADAFCDVIVWRRPVPSGLLAALGFDPRDHTPEPEPEPEPPLLSASETAVLQMAADGLGPKEIAAARAAAYSTVKTQLKRAYVKLGARNLSHAVALAWRADLIV